MWSIRFDCKQSFHKNDRYLDNPWKSITYTILTKSYHQQKQVFITGDGKSILQVPDTGTRVLDNTRPFLRSRILSFWIAPAHSKERKYHIFRQYWYTRNVPVFTNTGRANIWDLKYTFSQETIIIKYILTDHSFKRRYNV